MYEESIETWLVHADFKKSGKTEFVLESHNGEEKIFDLSIRRDTYTVLEK